MAGAIIVAVIGLVFITLGFLMWKKENITLLHSYHYEKVAPNDKKDFINYQVGCYLCWSWSCGDSSNNRNNGLCVRFYCFCIWVCCWISIADLCRSKI